MHDLLGQEPGVGRIRTLLNSASDPIPPKCRHAKKVTWAANVTSNEKPLGSGQGGKIVLDPVKCRALAVSQRELIECHYTNCSLACNHECEHSDQRHEDNDDEECEDVMRGQGEALS